LTDPATPSRGLLLFRAVVGIVAFGLLGVSFTELLGFVAFAGAKAAGGTLWMWVKDPGTGQLFLQWVATAVGFLVATALVAIVLRLSWADLRWRRAGGAGRGFAVAFVLGAIFVGLILVLGAGVGGARWVSDPTTPGSYAERIGLALLILAPAAFAEEIVFRGLPLVLLDRAAGRNIAIGVTALLFALAHSNNPSITTLSIGNICVAGLLLGIAFFAPGGFWTAVGFHLGWNWAIAALDAPVSGIDFQIPLINYDPGARAWLTGGAFGPEGGLLATLVLVLVTIVGSRLVLYKKPTAES
jgi:hypothetical protein